MFRLTIVPNPAIQLEKVPTLVICSSCVKIELDCELSRQKEIHEKDGDIIHKLKSESELLNESILNYEKEISFLKNKLTNKSGDDQRL